MPLQALTYFEAIRNSTATVNTNGAKRVFIVGRRMHNVKQSLGSEGTPYDARELGELCKMGGNGCLGGSRG